MEEVNYVSVVYTIDSDKKVITFYISEISYKTMMNILAEYPGYNIKLNPEPLITYTQTDNEDYFEKCICNPKNGGSGVCGCVLSNKIIY